MSRYVDISELEIPNDECSYEELEAFVEAVCESEYIDIVHCRECKHWAQAPKTDKGWCDRLDGLLEPTWYCADGEQFGKTEQLNGKE